MARLVLLSFDDNEDAETFVQAVTTGQHVFYSKPHPKLEGQYSVVQPAHLLHVEGLFMRPTQFCDCASKGKFNRNDGFSQGKKYGHWIHRCGKPSRMAWDEAAQRARLLTFGRNLLE